MSQRLRQGLRVWKQHAQPSFISESEPNHLKGGYAGAIFINGCNGTMPLCLNAFTCFFRSSVCESV